MIEFLRNQLKTLAPAQAAAMAFKLFCTPYSGKPYREPPAVFGEAMPCSIVFEGLKVNGFSWKPGQPNGKKVLINHGFDSTSYRFEASIIHFRNAGFEVFAFDAPGHGTSDGSTINVLQYRNTILAIEKSFGPFDAFLGHSLGATASALAAEQLEGAGRKLVLLAPVTETATAVSQFFNYLSLNNATRKAFDALIESMNNKPVSWYSTSRAVQQIAFPVLWVHDKTDEVCPYADTLPVQQMHLPNVTFVTTQGLGHSGIYRDAAVQQRITGFLLT